MAVLLKTNEVEDELGLDGTWQVLRMISRGQLDAEVMADGKFKATAAAVEAAAGSTDKVGRFRIFNQWPDGRPIRNFGDALKAAIRRRGEELLEQFETDPGRDVMIPFTGDLRSMALSEPRQIIFSDGLPDSCGMRGDQRRADRNRKADT